MLEIKGSWSFKKHLVLSLAIAILVKLATSLLTIRYAASIGIIGEVDGPTAIYVSSRFLSPGLYWLAVFVAILVLYRPIRYVLQKH